MHIHELYQDHSTSPLGEPARMTRSDGGWDEV